MGRGLSRQQRQILELGVAHNAARNAGTPCPVELLATEPAGTPKSFSMAIFGKPPLRWETTADLATAGVMPELCYSFLLVALGGFCRAKWFHRRWSTRYTRRRPMTVREKKWALEKGHDPDARPQTVPVRGGEVYGGVVWEPHTVCHKRRVSLERALNALEDRELVTWAVKPSYFLDEVERKAGENWREATGHFWEFRKRNRGAAFLRPEAFDVVGDDWRQHDAGKLLADWEQATARHVK